MKQTLVVPEESRGERADKFVAEALPEYSRSFWQKQFTAGFVHQNERVLGSKDPLVAGPLEIEVPDKVILAQDFPIIYEDDDVIVLNKPAGVLTHAKGVVNEEFTVADFVRPKTTDGPESNRPGIVHRLDRDTSGVIIAAKHTEAKQWLQKQFAERKVKKAYIALVEGHVDPAEAILRLPLERNPKQPQKFRVGANGKTAETAYKVEQYFDNTSLVTLRPHTGRTHQLRVHMAYVGHPIVGDRFYGKSKTERLFLHAAELEITLPNRTRQVFQAPLPADLQRILDTQHA